jgi:hypothetical protein
MYWNPRVDADPAHRWLRQQVADAAATLEPTKHSVCFRLPLASSEADRAGLVEGQSQ